MIHRNDERVFWAIELTCYVAMFLTPVAAAIAGVRGRPYLWPGLFAVLGAGGLMFLTRFFVYAHPENPGDRTRAEHISLSRTTKLLLLAGYAMCLPLFALGVVGLAGPGNFERAITFLSPMRFLNDGAHIGLVVVAVSILAGATMFIGITRRVPRLLGLGLTLLVVAVAFGLLLVR